MADCCVEGSAEGEHSHCTAEKRRKAKDVLPVVWSLMCNEPGRDMHDGCTDEAADAHR